MRLKICLLIFALCCACDAGAASYQQNTPFSQYGLIQNVQNYSSNPFWNPNGPYNQRMPQPVYVQGADMNAGDCMRTVASLIAAECGMRNNCRGLDISDIRPTIMIQLSRLPGHNYATSCAGFLDSEFNSYVSKYSTAAPTGTPVAFPTPGAPNTSADDDVQVVLPTPKTPGWAQDVKERQEELQNLQSQNGAGDEKIVRADFPTTAADLSFSERMQIQAAGYAPYKDKSAYEPLGNIVDEDAAYLQRLCSNAQSTLAILDADLATLTRCREMGAPLSVCIPKLQGSY